jgi:hypothetical protein
MSDRLMIPEPISGGIFLSYKCNSTCRHCLYACSARWEGDWLSEEDARLLLGQLAAKTRDKAPSSGRVNLNYGVHYTGGEPFLKNDLLLKMVQMGRELGLRSTFVETNCFWCRDDEATRERMLVLREAGLAGMLISANPFVVEFVPFEHIERAARIGAQVFGVNAIVYQRLFFDHFRRLGLKGTLSFEEFLQRAGDTLFQMELLPLGRACEKLSYLYQKCPAHRFFAQGCAEELRREWHMHIDNYGNYVPGYCGGISLGDAHELDKLCREGIDLTCRPVLKALVTNLGALYRLARERSYQELEGYISKCHLCLDIRKHLAKSGEFPELQPGAFYDRIGDG